LTHIAQSGLHLLGAILKEGPIYPLFGSSLALQNKLGSFFIIGKVLHNIINPYCKMPNINKINKMPYIFLN